MSSVISVENISKLYRLGEIGTGSLAHDVNRWWHRVRGKEDPYLKIGESNDRTTSGSSDYVWSLRDVSFQVEQGEVLGIIGRNGAGKSTLLKILSRVTKQTTGRIRVKGRIASLLEVGTGFHPELTGRENIFLNGAILGMRKHEIQRKFDEIVDFSGCERYIDTPVKRYSSGMYVRLAFAVAAHLESEILILDEVLAVGDAEFQKKCLGKMKDVSRGGRTVLFVSHNMEAVRQLCDTGLYLASGQVRYHGPIDACLSQYLSLGRGQGASYERHPDLPLMSPWQIKEAWLEQDNRRVEHIHQRTPLMVCMILEGTESDRASFEFLLRDEKDNPMGFCPLGLGYGQEHQLLPGRYLYKHQLELPSLAAGTFDLDIMMAVSGVKFLDLAERAISFVVDSTYTKETSWSFKQDRGQGSILLEAGKSELQQIT